MQKFHIDDVKSRTLHGGTINERLSKVFASPVSTIKRDSFSFGMSLINPGQVHEEHAHADNQELIYVAQGKGIGRVGGIDVDVKVGDIIGMEKGESHSFTNTGNEQLRLCWIYSPPGAEQHPIDD